MKPRFWKTVLFFLPIILLAAALAALAALQYRWIGQTSDFELEKMRENARLAAAAVSRDFDRELTRAFVQLQIDPISYQSKNWDNYALRYERWLANAPSPKIVRNVFIANKNEGTTTIRLLVYNQTNRRFEKTNWPPQLVRLQSEIERDLSGAENKPRTETLAADVPALVIPITTPNLLDLKNFRVNAAQDGTKQFHNLARRIGYTIVLLDADYIKDEFFPPLVARHFNFANSNEAFGYDVIVMNRDDSAQVIYQSLSAPRINTKFEGDAESDLFALKFDEIKNLLPAASNLSQTELSETSGEKQKRSVSVSVVAIGPQSNAMDLTANDASPFDLEKGRWRLVARHRNGSLEQAVEAMRQRNLTISFGVLLLLAASGGLLIVLLNRSQRVAQQQADFVAGVTHELRTPLAAIRTASENIAAGIVTNLNEIKEYGAMINEEERRLSALVEQALEFAGAQRAAPNNNYRFRRASVGAILAASLNDYQREIKASGFEVVLKIEPDLPEIMADRDALRRAVGNLIGNAVKYGQKGNQRQIEIVAQFVRGASPKQIEISVTDAGAGIEKKDLPHIFKLFYRGRTALENQTKGSGIGLSLVKKIVQAHGGTVRVTSRPNQGSTFTLRFPAAANDDFDAAFFP